MFPNWDCHPSGGPVERKPPPGFSLPPLDIPSTDILLNVLAPLFGGNVTAAATFFGLVINNEAHDILHDVQALAGTLTGTGRPACFVQGPIPWHHMANGNNRYAHIWPFTYNQESPATPHELRPSGPNR